MQPFPSRSIQTLLGTRNETYTAYIYTCTCFHPLSVCDSWKLRCEIVSGHKCRGNSVAVRCSLLVHKLTDNARALVSGLVCATIIVTRRVLPPCSSTVACPFGVTRSVRNHCLQAGTFCADLVGRVLKKKNVDTSVVCRQEHKCQNANRSRSMRGGCIHRRHPRAAVRRRSPEVPVLHPEGVYRQDFGAMQKGTL